MNPWKRLLELFRDFTDRGAEPSGAAGNWLETVAKAVPAVVATLVTIITPFREMLERWHYVGFLATLCLPLGLLVYALHVVGAKDRAAKAAGFVRSDGTPVLRYRYDRAERLVAKVGTLLAALVFLAQLVWSAPRSGQVVEGFACRSEDHMPLQRAAVDVVDGTGRTVSGTTTDDSGFFWTQVDGWALPGIALNVGDCGGRVPLPYAFRSPRGCPAGEDDDNVARYRTMLGWEISCPTRKGGGP